MKDAAADDKAKDMTKMKNTFYLGLCTSILTEIRASVAEIVMKMSITAVP